MDQQRNHPIRLLSAGIAVTALCLAAGACGSAQPTAAAAQQTTATAPDGAAGGAASSAADASPTPTLASPTVRHPEVTTTGPARSGTPSKPGTSASSPASGGLKWPAGFPGACPANASVPHAGQLVEALLMDPGKSDYVGTASGDGYCFWYKIGAVDYGSHSVRMLVADGKTGTQREFDGKQGDTVTVGRFVVRVVAPMGMWPGSHDVFDVAVYGA